MVNIAAIFSEGHQSSCQSLLFCGNSYIFYKVRMRIFFQAQCVEIWIKIVDRHYIPKRVIDEVKEVIKESKRV